VKVLLILPPFNRLYGIGNGYFPIGLGSIAAYLNQNGFDVKIYNAEMSKKGGIASPKYAQFVEGYQKYIKILHDDTHEIWQEIKTVIKNENPHIVGLSVMTAKYGSADIISKIVKRYNPDSFVVWGGPHPTIQPDEVLQNQNVDFVVRKEGELTFLELCQKIKQNSYDFAKIKGMSYKQKGKIQHNQDREYIKNLDILPFPNKELDLNHNLYSSDQMSVMVTSRGCPFNCGYCGAKNIWTRHVRYRSTENIMREIKQITNHYQSKDIFFWDDSFTSNRKRINELCKQIIADKIPINFEITTRVDLVDSDLLKLMKKAGLARINFGIETGSVKMLKLIDKGISQKQIIKAANLCNKIGITWNAFIMIGFPDETEDDIKMTLNFVNQIKPHTICLCIFTPYPGTQLYDRAKELSLIPDQVNWADFSHRSPKNHFVKNISKNNFQKIAASAAITIDNLNRANIFKRRIKSSIKHPIVSFKKLSNKLKEKFN